LQIDSPFSPDRGVAILGKIDPGTRETTITYWKIAAIKLNMSYLTDTPLLGNKIFVPGRFSHKEVDDPEDEYFILVDISDAGDGVYYSVVRLVGGKYGRPSTDDDAILQLDLDEFRFFRGHYMRH